MIKLIRAGLHRYIKNRFFIGGIICTALSSILSSFISPVYSFELYNSAYLIVSLFVQFMIHITVISCIIGNEHDDGTLRNKIISGYSKPAIFFSEIIINSIISILYFTVYITVFCYFHSSYFKYIPNNYLILMLINFSFAYMVFISIYISISCLVKSRTTSTFINLVLTVIIILLSNTNYTTNETKISETTNTEYFCISFPYTKIASTVDTLSSWYDYIYTNDTIYQWSNYKKTWVEFCDIDKSVKCTHVNNTTYSRKLSSQELTNMSLDITNSMLSIVCIMGLGAIFFNRIDIK